MFSVVRFDCEIDHKRTIAYITIEHPDFVAREKYYPIRAQVMDWLDYIDKHDMMVENCIDYIFDYDVVVADVESDYVYCEAEDFLRYIYPIAKNENCVNIIGFIIEKSKDILFGRGLSNYEKSYIVFNILSTSLGASSEIFDSLLSKIQKRICNQ